MNHRFTFTGKIKTVNTGPSVNNSTIGMVIDVTIHAANGTIAGFWFQAGNGERYFIAADDPELPSPDRFAVAEIKPPGVKRLCGRSVTREIIGSSVVTESGRLLGHISDVYISMENQRVIYRIVESKWQEKLGKGIYVDGSQTIAYSRFKWLLTVSDQLRIWRDPDACLGFCPVSPGRSEPARHMKALHFRNAAAGDY